MSPYEGEHRFIEFVKMMLIVGGIDRQIEKIGNVDVRSLYFDGSNYIGEYVVCRNISMD
jgi:hypothetical protein